MGSKYFFLVGVTVCFLTSDAWAQVPNSDAAPVVDYIRFRSGEEAGQPDVLETATSRFQNGNHVIDLVSVVHLGDTDYFKRLQQSLIHYDAVFYEMAGGPYTDEKAKMSREAGSPDGNLAQIQGLQQMAKRLLGLEFQMDGLNYNAPNFIHADLTAEEVSGIEGDKNLISGLLTRALQLAQSGKIAGLPATEVEANQLVSNLFGAVMLGDSNQLKRILGPILGEAELFMIELEEGEETVLISKRNKVAIDKILATKERRGQVAGNDAILFGAGHMPDLERRLLGLGYDKMETTWESSWVVNQGPSTNENPPNLDEMLKQITGMVEALKE